MRLTIGFVVLLLTGCGHGGDVKQLRADYAQSATCPEDRIVVTRRSDLELVPSEKEFEPATPPPDIAADPERLAMWNEQHHVEQAPAIRERAREYYRGFDVYEVSGCGAPAFYGCQTTSGVDAEHAARGKSSQRVCHAAKSIHLGSDPPRVVARGSN